MTDKTEAKVTCCGALEAMEKRDGSPIYRPMRVNPKTRQLTCEEWAIALTPVTPGGRVAKRGQGAVFIVYCPFCGAKVKKEIP